MIVTALAVSMVASLLVGEPGAAVRPCAAAVHQRAVKDGTDLAQRLLAAVRGGDSLALGALVAERGLTVADGLIPRDDLAPAMESNDTPLHQYLYDTPALQRHVRSVNPVMSLQDFARKAIKVTVEVKTNCFYEAPMAFVNIGASNLAGKVTLSLTWDEGSWRIQCFPDFSC